MTSHHIIYDITCTVFMTLPPIYLKWHPPYLCHHDDCIDGLRPTLCMTSLPLYVCQLMHSTQRHIHSWWLHTIVVITLLPLHSWHHTPYIWHHTHGNTNVISAIWTAISNTTSTLPVSSKTGYKLYHNHSLYDITQTICVTSYSVCLLSKQLFITSYPSVYNIHTQYIYDIISNTYAITILLSWEHNDYTWHLMHHIWHQSHCICVITQMAHTSVSMYRSIDDITTSV